jgi:hypothetical protein
MDNQPQFDGSKVTKMYSGRNGRCCCGCSGKYLNRGEEGFDRALKSFERRLKNLVDKQDLDLGGNYTAIEAGARIHIAYID